MGGDYYLLKDTHGLGGSTGAGRGTRPRWRYHWSCDQPSVAHRSSASYKRPATAGLLLVRTPAWPAPLGTQPRYARRGFQERHAVREPARPVQRRPLAAVRALHGRGLRCAANYPNLNHRALGDVLVAELRDASMPPTHHRSPCVPSSARTGPEVADRGAAQRIRPSGEPAPAASR